MVERTKLYNGIPSGAVYEACQSSLRQLNYSIKNEDSALQTLIADSSPSTSSPGQEIPTDVGGRTGN